MHHPRSIQLALGLASLCLVACDDDDNNNAESEAIATRLRECELVSEGEVRPAVPDFQLARCLAQCVADATCQELEALYCTANPSARVRDCQAACLTPECDGGERRYTLLQRCNGTDDCEDGRDEADCPELDENAPEYCADSGARITVFNRCNGTDDCEDGTDEANCPSKPALFTCEGDIAGFTRQIPQSQVCDLVPNCPDGSDESEEQGCAQRACE
jgi:hypothetical protein